MSENKLVNEMRKLLDEMNKFGSDGARLFEVKEVVGADEDEGEKMARKRNREDTVKKATD